MPTSTVQCNTIDEFEWLDSAHHKFAISNAVDVWRIAISDNLGALNNLNLLLQADEHARAQRYHQEKDRNRFIISRAYLRVLLGRYLAFDPKQIIFENGKNNKPRIKSPHTLNLYYNVSHSGNYILIAVADAEVGVDVENINPGLLYEDMLDIILNEEEITYIKGSHNPVEKFYTLWTRKEALLKATAKGIDDDLKLIPCLDGPHHIGNEIIKDNWLVQSFKSGNQYIGCIASRTAQINFLTPLELILD